MNTADFPEATEAELRLMQVRLNTLRLRDISSHLYLALLADCITERRIALDWRTAGVFADDPDPRNL